MISVEDDGEKQGKQLRIRLRKNKRNREKTYTRLVRRKNE
jgi:hypothetical protein